MSKVALGVPRLIESSKIRNINKKIVSKSRSNENLNIVYLLTR